MNHSWNHDPFQGGGPVPHRPKKQRRPIGTPVGRTLLNLAVTLVFGAIYFYVTLPPLNLHSGDFYVFVLLLCAVYCVCAVLTSGFQGEGPKGYFGFVKKQCRVPFFAADDESAVILNVGDEVTIRHATGEGSILKAYSIERGTSGTEA